MGFPVFNVATTWDSVVVSDCVPAQAYKNVLLTCIQYSFDRSTRMDINTAMKRKIQVCMHVNIQVMYLCYLHMFFIVGYGPSLPAAMFEHKASTGWPSQTDATIALPTHMPCADSMPNAANPQEFLKIRMPSHAIFSCNAFVYNGPAKRHLWSLGAVTSTRKRSCKEGWFQVPCCGDTNASTQMLKAVLPHLQIQDKTNTSLSWPTKEKGSLL